MQWLDRPTLAAVSFALRRLQQVSLQVQFGFAGLPLGLEDWSDVRRLVVGPMEVTELGSMAFTKPFAVPR